MEKIKSIEQFDALGVKICELLQVGIDKASTVVPDTLQQIVAWQIGINSFYTVVDVLLVILFSIIACKTGKMLIADLNSAMGSSDGFIGFIGFSISCVVIFATTIIFSTKICPALIKVLTAPNLVIIEQLGGLVK